MGGLRHEVAEMSQTELDESQTVTVRVPLANMAPMPWRASRNRDSTPPPKDVVDDRPLHVVVAEMEAKWREFCR